MPLPTDPRADWPPPHQKASLGDIHRWDAWYGGDEKKLAKAADHDLDRPSYRVRFWQNRQRDPNARPKQRLHVPIAGDIAATSAGLLFGEPVKLTLPGEDTGTESQDRLDELAQLLGLHNRLLEAAEIAAGLGGVYLRPVWDEEVADHPLLTTVHPDQAVPDFRFDRLVAVTFWEEIRREGPNVWRHLERHEKGVIFHGLYLGTDGKLGDAVALDSLPATADYEDVLELDGLLADRLIPAYVPNMLPNRKRRRAAQGRADFDGFEGALDALDETWTSWMRDIRLGAARLLVAQQFLTRGQRGDGASFNVDQEIFTPLNLDPGQISEGKGIDHVQFDLRVEQHNATATALTSRIVDGSGYSPETFGIHEAGPADSGRALRIRQGKTFRTKSRKEGYWTAPLAGTVETLLAIDRQMFGGPAEPARPRVEWADGIQDDERDRAETVELLARARAISTRMRVKMTQPELDGDDLDDEVNAVLAEEGMTVPDPMQDGVLP